MRQKRSSWALPLAIAVAVTVILAFILIYLELGDMGDPKDTEDSTQPVEDTVQAPIFKTDLSEYEKYMDTKDSRYLVVVNKQNAIDSTYEPEELEAVKDARKDIELSRTAQRALEAMFKEMREEGFKGIFVTSAYRSYSNQSSLFNTYINNEMSKGLSYEEAKEKVLTYSALPGTSEHHTGLCVDLMIDGMKDLDESFAAYPVYDWLLENAWKFGFILRYPQDKTDVTGYDFEPWHYRFVGRYHAYKIKSLGLCLEEYLESLEK